MNHVGVRLEIKQAQALAIYTPMLPNIKFVGFYPSNIWIYPTNCSNSHLLDSSFRHSQASRVAWGGAGVQLKVSTGPVPNTAIASGAVLFRWLYQSISWELNLEIPTGQQENIHHFFLFACLEDVPIAVARLCFRRKRCMVSASCLIWHISRVDHAASCSDVLGLLSWATQQPPKKHQKTSDKLQPDTGIFAVEKMTPGLPESLTTRGRLPGSAKHLMTLGTTNPKTPFRGILEGLWNLNSLN